MIALYPFCKECKKLTDEVIKQDNEFDTKWRASILAVHLLSHHKVSVDDGNRYIKELIDSKDVIFGEVK